MQLCHKTLSLSLALPRNERCTRASKLIARAEYKLHHPSGNNNNNVETKRLQEPLPIDCCGARVAYRCALAVSNVRNRSFTRHIKWQQSELESYQRRRHTNTHDANESAHTSAQLAHLACVRTRKLTDSLTRSSECNSSDLRAVARTSIGRPRASRAIQAREHARPTSAHTHTHTQAAQLATRANKNKAAAAIRSQSSKKSPTQATNQEKQTSGRSQEKSRTGVCVSRSLGRRRSHG